MWRLEGLQASRAFGGLGYLLCAVLLLLFWQVCPLFHYQGYLLCALTLQMVMLW